MCVLHLHFCLHAHLCSFILGGSEWVGYLFDEGVVSGSGDILNYFLFVCGCVIIITFCLFL